jgi:cytochrome c-type biogenesis protein CcmH/NrfG
MIAGRIGALGLGLPLLMGLLGGASPTAAATPIGDAISLYEQKRYAEARVALEPLAAADPSNAEAAYYLGMAVFRAGGPSSLASARLWLGMASRLSPKNEDYLAQYAGVCLLIADRDNSLSLAMEGRDAMTRAIAQDPADLEACEGLMRFYAKAPWPLGDPSKALSLAAAIAKVDPKRGAAAYRSIGEAFEKSGHKEEARSAAEAAQSLAPARHP